MSDHEDLRRERPLFEADPAEEVREELDFHLAMRAHEYRKAGLPAGEAERAALGAFVDYEGVAAECRQLAEGRNRRMRQAEWTTEIRQDIRYAVRQLSQAPGFAGAAVLTLALGIGGTAVMFGAVESVLLRPYAFAEADRLVVPQTASLADGTQWSIAYGDYEDWRDAGVFESVAAYRLTDVNVAGGTEAQRVQAAVVTEDFLRVLRLAPSLGGPFNASDHEAGAPMRVLLSHRLWQSAFGGAADVVGSTIRVAGRPAQVAGVLPEGMSYPMDVDVWRPLQPTPESRADWARRDNYIFFGIARLATGQDLAATRTQLATLAGRVAAAEPATRGAVTVTAIPLGEWIVGETVSRTLWVLLAAVAVVLLIGCVNIANLLLTRSAGRSRELAIRAALGASRSRVARQLITESLVLASLGGAAGVLLAVAGMRLLVRVAPPGLPRVEAIGVSPAMIAFAVAVSLLSALLFGTAPAWRASRSAAAGTLVRTSPRSTADLRARRGGAGLVVAEIALALLLLVGAGLLLQSFLQLQGTDPGIQAEGVLTFEVSLQGERFPDATTRTAAFSELLETLAALPGVENAAITSGLPLGGGGFYLGRAFLPDGRPEPPAGDDVSALWNVVSPGYFATLGIPLLAGRDFGAVDVSDGMPVMIVNREFARRMFADGDPIGRRIRSWRDENVYRQVVGVVDDVRYFGAGDEIRPLVYVPHPQDAWSGMVVVLRTSAAPTSLLPAVRTALRSFDPSLGLARAQSMDAVLANSVAPSRFTAWVIGAFAAFALVLAVVGIYGVVSYGVAQRSREIGIRMALGARRGEVLTMIVREAGVVVLLGVGLGLVSSLVLTRFAAALLYDVSATDPLTFAGVAVLIAASALLASLVPARRAASVHPATTLRSD